MRQLPTSSRSSFRSATRRGGIALPLAIVLAAGVAIGGTAYFVTRGGESSEATSAALYQANMTSFEVTVEASGELEAAKQTEIRSELEKPADIVSIVDEGTRVKKGDLLIELASETIKNDYDEEQLRVEQARNDQIGAENTLEIQKNTNDSALRDAKLKLELAKIEYEKWQKGDDVKQMRDLELNIETAAKDAERAKEKFDRSQNLYDHEFLSHDELKTDEITSLRAQAAIEKAKLEKTVYEEYERAKQIKTLTSAIEQATAELDRVERSNASNLASRQADVVNRTRSLRIHEDKLAKLEEQIRKTKIFAPQDGLVVYATSLGERRGMMMFGGSGPLQVGYTVRPNEELIILPDTSGMVASVRVHESLAGRVHPGQKASIKVDAAQGRVFQGKVQSIGILAESGGWRDPNLREYTVKIAIETTPEEGKVLKPAMRAESEIVLGKVDDALTVPIQAVFNDGPTRFVYVPEGGQFRKVPVLIGQRSNTYAQILAGLDQGTSVLLREPGAGEIVSSKIPDTALAALTERAKELGIPMGPARGAPGAGAPAAPGAGATGGERGARNDGQRRERQGAGETKPADNASKPAEGETKPEATPTNASEPATTIPPSTTPVTTEAKPTVGASK